MKHGQSNRCEDPSTPSENLRFSSVAQDDRLLARASSLPGQFSNLVGGVMTPPYSWIPSAARPCVFYSRNDKHNVRTVCQRALPTFPPRSPAAARPYVFYSCNDKHNVRTACQRALPAGFTKNSVYFLCKVCYTIISVRRDGQTRADEKEKTQTFCGQTDHLPDDTGSKGMALAAWNSCAFLRKLELMKGVYKQIG